MRQVAHRHRRDVTERKPADTAERGGSRVTPASTRGAWSSCAGPADGWVRGRSSRAVRLAGGYWTNSA